VNANTVLPRTWPRRTAQRLLALVGAVVLGTALLVTGAGPAAAAPSPAAAEQQFLQLLNRTRLDHRLAPLQSDPAIIPIAREWSASMSGSKLAHRPDLRAQFERRVTTAWQRIGENVGVGGEVAGLHDAFMRSPTHKANVVGDFNRVGIGVVVKGDTIWVTFNFLKGAAINGATGVDGPAGDLWLASDGGDVWAFGKAKDLGSLSGKKLAAPIVGITPTRSDNGYWLVGRDGGIFSFGDARFHGSTGAMRLNQPIVGMAATPSGNGYWLVASDGGIFAFGDARFHGSTGGTRLNQPIATMAATPTGRGYWLTATDGGVFSFGDAGFHGSTGGTALSAPVADMAATGSGRGYRMVSSDGRVYSFGDAGSGASGPVGGNRPVVAVAVP
jgi:uncharacterized protein YkwD